MSLLTFKGDIPRHIYTKTIICSPRQYEKLKDRYKKWSVHAQFLAPEDRWYYFSALGHLRTVMNGAIWVRCEHQDPWDIGYLCKKKEWSALGGVK